MGISVGLVLHHHRPEAVELGTRALEWCETCGVEGRLPAVDAELLGRPELGEADDAVFGKGLDVCLSLGGDGTMLRSTDLVARHEVPVMGVNVGRLGYLTTVDPDELEAALTAWHAGSLAIDERMLLDVTVETAETEVQTAFALNEVVVERAEPGHTVSVVAEISGKRFTRYLADGLIVATPTGSTAYSLSAGGPIVEPGFEALVLTPVAAHMVFNRSMVFAPSTEVRLTIDGYRPAIVSIDGRQLTRLEPGQSVLCRASDRRARFVMHGETDFHTVLKDKFGLEDR